MVDQDSIARGKAEKIRIWTIGLYAHDDAAEALLDRQNAARPQ